jgi:hypothetical protein
VRGEGGLCISARCELEVEYFTVEELPSARGPRVTVAEAALAGSDLPTAVRYSGLTRDSERIAAVAARCLETGAADLAEKAFQGIGLFEKAARIRVASLEAAAGRQQDAIVELRCASASKRATTLHGRPHFPSGLGCCYPLHEVR